MSNSNHYSSTSNQQKPICGGHNSHQAQVLNNSCSKGIVNVDQGYFHNLSSKKIVEIPVVDLAYITNCDNNNESDVEVYLNPTYLKWCDFCLLFFRPPSGSFYINTSNTNVSAISFFDQTYESTQNKKVSFSLYDQIFKAWSKKNNKPTSSIPISHRIQLERETFLNKNLSSTTAFQLGLSLDEVISGLINKKQIEPSNDHDSSATVKLNISYRNFFCPLDIAISVVFTYITNIPGYKNVVDTVECGENGHYSKEIKPSRREFDFDDNASYISSESEHKIEHTTIHSGHTGHNSGFVTEFSLEDISTQGDIQSQIQKIVDDNSSTSQNSGSWNN